MQTKYIAHITIEAKTPLRVGCGNSDFFQDAPVQRDFNSLPMILGTSISGVLRSLSDDKNVFGYQDKESREDKGEGSKVIVSNALLVDENNKVNENLLIEKSDFLKLFDNLPIREHTAMNDKGVVKESGKFDQEIVYKGSRFRFLIEVIEDKKVFDNIINILQNPLFRLGGKTTAGFGSFEIVDIATKEIKNIEDLKNYSSSLNHLVDVAKPINKETENYTNYHKYILKLKPDDFFIFGSGFGDEEADMVPVYEQVIDYEKKSLSEKEILIPATSIKGAISHRTAFHFNKKYIKELEERNIERENIIGENNKAVKEIFGHKKEKKEEKEIGQKGNIYISDCFMKDNKQTKIFDHVSIDRLTGGAIEGALFQEKTIADDREYNIEIILANNIEDKYIHAFEESLKDICKGELSLGGMTTKGHGIFSGKIYKNGEVIYEA